jgi:hypothetical protein
LATLFFAETPASTFAVGTTVPSSIQLVEVVPVIVEIQPE